MYVAVKGGERAIENAHALLARTRRGDPSVPEISPAQISEQLALSVDRVMSEGSLYDRELAALAIKQARGDLIEAIFLVRAYRTTTPRFGASEPIDTAAMDIRRRISATFKDLPGGQVLGPTFDYTHRLLDHALAEGGASLSRSSAAGASPPPCGEGLGVGVVVGAGGHSSRDNDAPPPHPSPTTRAFTPVFDGLSGEGGASGAAMPRVTDLLAADGLIEPSPASEPNAPVGDLTREPLSLPAERDLRLQNLARGDEGFLLALGYSTQRGYGRTHPFAGEIRFGEVEVEFLAEELGFAVPLGRVALTECQMVNQFAGTAAEPPRFTRGYGLTFGQGERKAMAMALVDRALRARELGEDIKAPAQDEEFVLLHSDNVQATGFVEHLKLPHYVDFQAELGLVRRLRKEFAAADHKQDVAEAAE
jgi:alpha-D-ribose 1-methylphosphonate 5-triphosphate synthase subunit PhnI